MKSNLASLTVGLIFALGLGFSGMTQPQKVIGFLDLFGDWDPSLLFVMIGAIGIHLITFKFIRKTKSPWFSKEWHIPISKDVTPSLVGGSVIFGFGWGLGGYCPGPAVTSLASLEYRPFVFVLSMIVGMILFRFVDQKLSLKK